MLPLRDENPTTRTPVLTIGIMAACVLVFLLQMGLDQRESGLFLLHYGFIPSIFFGHEQVPPHLAGIPPFMTIVTSMFLHGGIMHLGGNMLFLWIFGNNIEDELGPVRFVIFYLLAGAAAALAQGLMDTESGIPMVGASGAISGVMGAYMLLYPRARIQTLIFLGYFITTARIPAIWFLGVYFGLQWLNAILTAGQDGAGVAWWAHIGGFVAGVVLLFFLKPRKTTHGTGRGGTMPGPWG